MGFSVPLNAPTPEQKARELIDSALETAGWVIQDRSTMNLHAGPGVAVREFKMAACNGFADYLLFIKGKAVGALEAKPVGYAEYNVELQEGKYANGLPAGMNPPVELLPFQYISISMNSDYYSCLSMPGLRSLAPSARAAIALVHSRRE